MSKQDRKNIIKIGDKEFKISPKKHVTKKEREEALIKEATVQAGGIYAAWKKQMTSTPCKPQNLPGRVLAFKDMIQKKIKNKYVKKILLDLADTAYRNAVAVAHSHTISLPSHPNEGQTAATLAAPEHEPWCDTSYGKACNCKVQSE